MIHLNLDETRQWLDIVYGDTPGYLHVCSVGDWEGQVFEPGDTPGALSYIQELDAQKREGIYLRAATLRQRPQPGHRGGDEQSFFLPGLWADIDLAGPGHKTTKPLPQTVDDALRIVAESGMPEPSHWIHTGGGLYPWWLFHKPVEITDLEDFRALSGGWQKVIEASAAKLGFFYGSGIGDLSRVLRVPGTVNRKAGLERPCAALEGHSWGGRRYSLEELREAMIANIPAPPPVSQIEIRLPGAAGERPGDLYNTRTQWQELLPGWKQVYERGDKTYLRRPGKREGVSATISSATDRLWVFSDATEFDPMKHYSKFEAYTHLHHHGNFADAANTLASQGFRVERRNLFELGTLDIPNLGEPAQLPQAVATSWRNAPVPRNLFQTQKHDFEGAAMMVGDCFSPWFRYVRAQKDWKAFDMKVWRTDRYLQSEQAVRLLLHRVREAAKSAEDADSKKMLEQFGKKLAGAGAAQAVLNWARSDPRIICLEEDFDPDPNLVTVDNGVLNLETRELHPHDPKFMNTRMLGAGFDPEARAPRWLKFLDEVLPDPEVQRYIQKAIGHTLTGRAEQRAMFLLHGESGTGKSQFIKVMELMFGDLAETAAATTFTAVGRNASITNDLNDLKGSRFASISELDQDEKMAEALLKRMTGGDTAKSRALWQENTKWKVQFTLWMATNHLPRLSSDDNAMWRRVKPIRFPVVIKQHGKEEPRLAEAIYKEESAGILNWMLEGLRLYLEEGLDDISQITDEVENYRNEVDVVKQFLDDRTGEDALRVGEQEQVGVRILHQTYTDWSRRNNMAPLGERRFSQRIQSLGFEKRRMETGMAWEGIGVNVAQGLLGTMGNPYHPRR